MHKHGMRALPFALSLFAASVAAQPNYPEGFPSTPYPEFEGCSNSQEAYLKKAWRLAHYYSWRADRLLQHIGKQSGDERIYLWNLDFQDTLAAATSPRNFFGSYTAGSYNFVEEAVQKAVRRFEQRGSGLKGIRTVRCGQPRAPRPDEHTDVCPAGNPGADGSPSAYHAPAGVIVTCPEFWIDVNNNFDDPDSRLFRAARTLVHEIFHWLSVDGHYVKDRHGDGAGGHKDKKYYGAANVAYLAEHQRTWATRNNDSYARFIANAGNAKPLYSAVWTKKEGSGTGGLFLDLTWDKLVERWKELGTGGQYLSSVSTYVLGGTRRYTGVWRIGRGNGALYQASWPDFAAKFSELKKTQDLIDIEVFKTGDSFTYLGVWRQKQPGSNGDGGLLNDLTWNQLTARWNEFHSKAWLCDVETYLKNGKRRYVAVWRAGAGNGSLYRSTDWGDFDTLRRSVAGTEDLVDFERDLTGDGKWLNLGVWRKGSPSGQIQANANQQQFLKAWQDQKAGFTLVDVEVFVPLPLRIR